MPVRNWFVGGKRLYDWGATDGDHPQQSFGGGHPPADGHPVL